jgi:hypothetical protein
VNLSLPSLRREVKIAQARYEKARQTYLDDPTDPNRFFCSAAAQNWADAQANLQRATEDERREQAAAALDFADAFS